MADHETERRLRVLLAHKMRQRFMVIYWEDFSFEVIGNVLYVIDPKTGEKSHINVGRREDALKWINVEIARIEMCIQMCK